MSPQNSQTGKEKKRVCLGESSSPGGSADTFRGFLAYLDSVHASWFIWENVDLTKGQDAQVTRGRSCYCQAVMI